MYDGMVVERGECSDCGRVRFVALLPTAPGALPYSEAPAGELLRLCADCISALQRLAYHLRRLEAPVPKKPRKRAVRQPRAIATPADGSEHDGGMHIAPANNLLPEGQPGAAN